jgi:hypothetical protein
VRRAGVLVLLLVLLALVLTGCETNEERSARLAKLARHGPLVRKGLSITRESADVKVVGATVLHGSEEAAAVVMLRNASSHTLRDVPIAITVKNARGGTLFQNNAPGLEAALVSVPSLAPHAELTWIDDQVPLSGNPATVGVQVGEAPSVTGSVPRIDVAGVHLAEDPANGVGAAGTVSNRSKTAQRSLVVFGVARRAGRIVAAGRAVLPEVAAGASTSFQVFFVGDPSGARLEMSAPPTTLK